MPRLDGFGMLTRLRADKSVTHIPVVMTSMSDAKATAYSLGAVDFVSKPLNARAIIERLDKWRATKLTDVVVDSTDEAALSVQAALAGTEAASASKSGDGAGSSDTKSKNGMW